MTNKPKSILVYLPAATVVERIMDVALPLAQRFAAHLTGVHILPHPMIFADPGIGVSLGLLSAQLGAFEEEAKRIGAAFAGRLGAHPGDWITIPEPTRPVMQSATDLCRTTDLVVAPQYDQSMPGAYAYFPEDLVMGGGRPVLLVPYAGRFAEVGHRVLIAWNNSRESARATFDALPLLNERAEITLLLVAQDGEFSPRLTESAARVHHLLVRHGFAAKLHRSDPQTGSVGDDILSRAADLGSDLIVMGCYGHSRLRETVFGGATRTLLDQMTVPVLMAH